MINKNYNKERPFEIDVRSYSHRETLLADDVCLRIFHFVKRIHYVAEKISKALRQKCFNRVGLK